MSHALHGLASRQRPRALLSSVYAAAPDPTELLHDLKLSVTEFKAKYDGKLDNIQSALDDLAVGAAANRAGPGGQPIDREYSTLFGGWARSGHGEQDLQAANVTGDRRMINAALSSGSSSDGGYLAPVEWDRQVTKSLTVVSPMRRLATIRNTTVKAFSTVWNSGGWGSGWVGETANRPATTTATLAPVEFAAGEIYANPQITQGLLDDAAFDIEQWIADEVAAEFEKQESVAFVSGDGVNKPFGFLTYGPGGVAAARHPGGTLQVTVSGAAAALTGDGLITAVYSLAAPYRANAVWLMNSLTAASAAKLKDGQGNYLWRESFIVGQPATLLGYPVEICESMPDLAANATPIAFGDFRRGYLINDRVGVRVLRDPYTAKPYVGFYTTKRVGGGVWDPNAIRLLKIAAS